MQDHGFCFCFRPQDLALSGIICKTILEDAKTLKPSAIFPYFMKKETLLSYSKQNLLLHCIKII
jgi:hypothetical protein